MLRITRRVLAGARKAPPRNKQPLHIPDEQPPQEKIEFRNPYPQSGFAGNTNPFLLFFGSFIGIYLAFSLMNGYVMFSFLRQKIRTIQNFTCCIFQHDLLI